MGDRGWLGVTAMQKTFFMCISICMLAVLGSYILSVQVWVHICACIYGGPKMTSCVSIIPSFICWTLTECRSCRFWLPESSICQLARESSIPDFWVLEFQAAATTAQLFVWILQIQPLPLYLGSKHLIDWTISQAQTAFFFSLKFPVKPKIALKNKV